MTWKFQALMASAIAIAALAWHAEGQQAALPSLQMQGVEQVAIDVDLDAPSNRWPGRSSSLRSSTRIAPDTRAFDDYHAFLGEAYPRVHETLKRAILGDPRPYSLLYAWEGKNPDLPPALFYAHQDVVPAAPDSLDQWNQEPFAGAVSDG